MRYLSFVLLLPYITDFTPADSSYTEFSFGAGSGQYTTLDCGGLASSAQFGDVGVSGKHKFEGPFRVGAGATIVAAKGGKPGIIRVPVKQEFRTSDWFRTYKRGGWISQF